MPPSPSDPFPSARTRLIHGPLTMMAANLFFGATPLFVRLSGRGGIPSIEITAFRFAFACVVIALLVAIGWGKLATKNWPALVWRGIFGGLAVVCYFYAIERTSAGEGTLLNYTHSIWANLFLVLFFRQKAPRGFWVLLAVAAVGLWLVLDPHFSSFKLGQALGLISGMMGGGAILSTKKLRQTDNALTIFTSFSVVGLIFSLVPPALPESLSGEAALAHWAWPSGAALAALVAMAAVAMAGQLLFTHGYGFTSVPMGTLLSLSVPALAALGGWAFLGEPLTPHFILGGALIMAACGALGFQEGMTFRKFEKPAATPREGEAQAALRD